MREPAPPFLELNFFPASPSDKDLFLGLIEFLASHGATMAGKGYVHLGNGISRQRFASITDCLMHPISIDGIEEARRVASDPDNRLIQVFMYEATGAVPDVAEIVTYVSISEEASQLDSHPVAIWTEGAMFSDVSSARKRQCRWRAGQQIYRRFLSIVAGLKPAYAAITQSWPLECPTDLARDPRTSAFRNFYIARDTVGEKGLLEIRALFTGAHMEEAGEGLYVSCTGEFNPAHKTVRWSTSAHERRSREVARLLATQHRWQA